MSYNKKKSDSNEEKLRKLKREAIIGNYSSIDDKAINELLVALHNEINIKEMTPKELEEFLENF